MKVNIRVQGITILWSRQINSKANCSIQTLCTCKYINNYTQCQKGVPIWASIPMDVVWLDAITSELPKSCPTSRVSFCRCISELQSGACCLWKWEDAKFQIENKNQQMWFVYPPVQWSRHCIATLLCTEKETAKDTLSFYKNTSPKYPILGHRKKNSYQKPHTETTMYILQKNKNNFIWENK